MTGRHSPLFTLESGPSGLGFYTTERDAAPPGGVQAIGFGVFVVIGPQIGRLLRGHHHHLSAMAPKPGRQWYPGVTGGLHHHRDVVLAVRDAFPEGLKISDARLEANVAPEQLTGGIRTGRTMGSTTGDVNSESKC